MRPVQLGPNQPRQFYKGGKSIAELRGLAGTGEFGPEDWVASATPRFGRGDDGLTVLPDGRYLRDVIDADPHGWLGPEHVEYFGADPALLVKLLDAGQRLPVHVHPDRSFAVRHLGSRHGKTEAWVVLGTSGPNPVVYVGWTRDVEQPELSRMVADQGRGALLGLLNELTVKPGDAVLVPAGTAHAIGAGVFSLELQEPTDFSIMLELEGFDIDPAGAYLGLDREVAISCVSGRALGDRELALVTRRGGRSYPEATASEAEGGSVEDILPEAARPYFRAQRARGGDGVSLEPSFAVVLAVSGKGSLRGDGWEVGVQRGDTFVVPWGAGPVKVEGHVELLRSLPPLPADAAKDDPGAPGAPGSVRDHM
jgi:mannose-6-phosphate isomerase